MNIKNILGYLMVSTMILFAQSSFALDTTTVPDTNITSSINNKLAADTSLSGSNIKASTSNGIVTLSGNVTSDTQVNNAIEIAQATPGVKDVDTSGLTINGSQQPVSDALITAKVKGVFIQQKLFGTTNVAALSIQVQTNNGIVSLSGTADNQDQINNAITLAKSVSGVKDVKSTVAISPSN